MCASSKPEAEQYSIDVQGLTKRYGQHVALNNIAFNVRPGEIIGFLGPNGAGKTTTMKILTCFMGATEGTARVAGFDVHQNSEEVRRRIGYLPENVPLYEEMLVYDYLMFIAQVRGVPAEKRHERIRAVAQMTGLEQVISRAIFELSKGYRQRVGLAQAIIHEPDVIILDEPTTGLDPNQIIEIRDVIKRIGREKTIIFSTHILQEVTAVCDRIIIINRGQIVANGTLAELEAKVAEVHPGILVEFARDKSASVTELTKRLKGLDGVRRVVELASRGEDTWNLRLETGDEAKTRKALFALVSEENLGLVAVRRSEPTLEDIFRMYTAASASQDKGADTGSNDADTSAKKDREVAHA